jgi:hypothetical protein
LPGDIRAGQKRCKTLAYPPCPAHLVFSLVYLGCSSGCALCWLVVLAVRTVKSATPNLSLSANPATNPPILQPALSRHLAQQSSTARGTYPAPTTTTSLVTFVSLAMVEKGRRDGRCNASELRFSSKARVQGATASDECAYVGRDADCHTTTQRHNGAVITLRPSLRAPLSSISKLGGTGAMALATRCLRACMNGHNPPVLASDPFDFISML